MMQRADVLVVGGGPAGASCASRLVEAGLNVLVLDRGRFSREKPGAGWITPEVVQASGLPLHSYALENALQPIRHLRVGWIGGGSREVEYPNPVSYGVRRREFDQWLLRKSEARVCIHAVHRVRRSRERWVIDDAFSAPFLVGAAGHFCPVARELIGTGQPRSIVVAQELEIRLTAEQASQCHVAPDRPELDFTDDLSGFGWCIRRGDSLTVGVGRRDPERLSADTRSYLDWLKRKGRIPNGIVAPLRAHSYRLREGTAPRVAAEGVLLVGDAAGLAHASSGEGILPALLSGQAAAEVLLESTAGRASEAFESYPGRLAARLGPHPGWTVPGPLRALAGKALLGSRHAATDRMYVHSSRPTSLVAG